MILYRPVGLKELELIAASGWREFPPRLVWQPIFYPVLSHDYAHRICADWNAKEPASGRAGFVTRFEVDDSFVSRYPVQEAGGRACRELWVPADELAEFNRHIRGTIEVVESIYGNGFDGKVDPLTKLPVIVATSRRAKGSPAATDRDCS
ncbi:MAG TPA: hypothetical protein VH475_11340 [Tepidisphaeraceae bacterium]|jgi:hypothetical protein